MRDDPEFNIQFCQLVEQYPALYDYSNSNYSNRNMQDKLWGIISKKVSASVKECKERWKNIRGRYSKYLKSLNMPSGSAAKAVKEYYLAHHLHYIDNFLRSRTPKSNLSNSENNEDDSNDSSLLCDSPARSGSDLVSTLPTAFQDTDAEPLPTKSPQYTLKDVNKTAYEYFASKTKEMNSGKNNLDQTDTDLAFLRSMLPDMKSMNQAQKRKFKIGVLKLSEQILNEPMPRHLPCSRKSYRTESPYIRTPITELPYQRSSSRESDYNSSSPSDQAQPYPTSAVQETQGQPTSSRESDCYSGFNLPMYSPVTPATPQSFSIVDNIQHTSNENIVDYDNLINLQ